MIKTNINQNYTGSDAKALLELESNSTLNKALTTLIKTSFLEQRPLNWKPVKCELVVNTKLTDEFIRIKQEFQRGHDQKCEFEENYGFLIETDAQVNNICQNGYFCQESVYNVLGQSKSGIYLSKYADIAMKYSENKKWPENLTLKMIIFKICYGKQTLAMVRKVSKLQPIPPTVGFHSHSSVIPPKESDDIETQFDHSQIYLYELNSEKVAAKRPRHCLPYAVITWLKFTDGTEWPHNFNDLEEMKQYEPMLNTDTIQVAMATDDVYMKNKLKDILRITEEAHKNELLQANEHNTATNGSTSPNNNQISNENENNLNNNNNGSTNNCDNEVNDSETKIQQGEPTTTDTQNTRINEIKSPLNSITNGAPNINNSPVTTTTSLTTATATSTVTTTASSTTVPTTTTSYHNKTYSHFQKPINTYAYRQATAAAMTPYILAQSPSPYGAIRIPYLAQSPAPSPSAQQFYTTGASPYANLAAAQGLQQQIYLCRGPNGLTYVAGPPAAHVLGAPAAQAAYIQQTTGASPYTGAPAAYKLPVATFQQYASPAPQAPQPQQQIIYQAAPQPSQSAAASSNANKSSIIPGTNNLVVAGTTVQQQNVQALQAAANQQQAQQQALQAAANQQQVQAVAQTQVNVHAPPTQSPKQTTTPGSAQPTGTSQYSGAQYASQNANAVYATQSQINQMQQLAAAYPGQSAYLAYAPTATNNIATTMGHTYYTNPSNYVLAQTGQQIATPTQTGIYGYTAQIPGAVANGYAAAPQQAGQISMTLPSGTQTAAGYQIIDYRSVGGIPGATTAVQIDQFGQAASGIVPRPRFVNVRHHPYQRN